MSESLRETRAKLQGELQQIVEHNGEITSEMADRFDQLENDVRGLDGQIRSEDIRTRFEGMQAEPVTPRMAPGANVETADASNDWDPYVRCWRSLGRDRSAIDARALNTSDDSAVIPDVLQAEMARKFGAVTGALAAVRRSQLPSKASVPQVASRVAITGVTAEGTSFTGTEPTFAEVDFTSDEMGTASTELTVQAMADAEPDLMSETSLQHAEELGRLWSNIICNGVTVSGSLRTDGLFASASLMPAGNKLTAAGTAAITAQELIDLRYKHMPAEYWNSYGALSWVMGQDTFAHVAGLVDSGTGRPLLQPFADSTLAAGFGLTLLGLPVHLDAGAPALATGNTTVVLLAQNAYRFIERTPGLVTAIDPFTGQASGKVTVNTYQRGVGRFVRPEACATLTQA